MPLHPSPMCLCAYTHDTHIATYSAAPRVPCYLSHDLLSHRLSLSRTQNATLVIYCGDYTHALSERVLRYDHRDIDRGYESGNGNEDEDGNEIQRAHAMR